ncbi:hypothetical protein HOLleu_13748 [Holothuria leucospilota]|uniref:Uncharacterized protein n=1 Tax=Holothuria leucospilota TaxID=206669 RepID=A0A9Q1C754_HOLLE|nr:hypothetical protein HOLleu_13748 [Holothuria leucospilota]
MGCAESEADYTNVVADDLNGFFRRFEIPKQAFDLPDIYFITFVIFFFSCLDVKILLPRSLPHASYNISHQGEIAFVYGSITDQTLADELSNDIKEQVATSYNIFTVDISVVLGTKEKHGVLSVHVFTNSTKKIIPPYFTNCKDITYVDSIEEKDDGTVTIRLGDDVMVYWWQEVKSKDQNKVGEDFEKVFGEVIAATNYPLPFDWGCQFWGFHTSFCQALNEVQCELTAVGGDVCALTSTSSSERLPTTTKIVNMTGIFRDMFPFLVETVPIESFEAEVAEREHTTGITFPCLSR